MSTIQKFYASDNLAWTGWAQDFVTRANSADAYLTTFDGKNCLYTKCDVGYDDPDNKYLFTTDWKPYTWYRVTFNAYAVGSGSIVTPCKVVFTDNTGQILGDVLNDGEWHQVSTTITDAMAIKYITLYNGSGAVYIDLDSVMISEGQTELPYEPYGSWTPILHEKKVNGAFAYDPQTYQRINGAWVSKKWSNIKALVDAGVHQQYFSVGDQETCKRGNDTILWDIVDMDDSSMTFLTHDCLFNIQFDAKEAMFAFENGLAAGTYHFTVRNQPWYASDVGKTIQFTLTEAIPAGGQLVVQNSYATTMIGKEISSYTSGLSTTAIESVTMSEGSDGTDLGSLTNAGTPSSGINSVQRGLLGSNRWSTSAIRQFLNSDASAGSVWTPQTLFDRPPTWVSSQAGFKNGLETDFLSAITANVNTTVLNTVTDGGGTETTTDMFYLPSRTEIYGSNESSSYPEGTQFDYYVGTDNSAKVKKYNNSAVSWWLRTPYSPSAYGVRIVNTSGAVISSSADYTLRVAVACKITRS